MFDVSAAPASVLAFLTTVHLAMVVLRAHRSGPFGPVNFVCAVSFLLSLSPWFLSSPLGLAAGLATHIAWFIACEQLLPAPVAAGSQPRAAATPAMPSSPARKAAASAPPAVARAARPAARLTGPDSTATSTHRPRGFVPAPVVAVFDETPDIKTFRMARPEGFEFKAGQFLTVRLRADGCEHVRCYSISSPPGSRGHLEITVKRLGMVSGALHASVRPGSMLHVRPPNGAFVYPHGEDRPLVFIAGGVGITPIMSMLRHAIEEEPTRPASLFYSVRTMQDIAFRDELMMLNRRHAQLSVFISVSDGPVASDFFPGRINEALVTTMAPDVQHAICLLCGPPPMLDAMTTMLADAGVPRGQISFEVFQAAIAASAGGPPPHREPESAAGSIATGDAAHQVSFRRSGRTAMVGSGEKLLEVAEACGAEIPSLCRAGVCGTCRTKVLSGDVHCASRVLEEQDRRDGYVLACVSEVLSDCAIDA